MTSSFKTVPASKVNNRVAFGEDHNDIDIGKRWAMWSVVVRYDVWGVLNWVNIICIQALMGVGDN